MQGKKRVGARKRGAAECEGQCASEWAGEGRAAGGRLASSSESWRRGGRSLEVELKEEVLNSRQK